MSDGDASPGQLLDAAHDALERASGATGRERALLLREASRALFAAGDEPAARAAAREAFDAWPADDAAFAEALRDGAAEVDRLAHVLAARARAVPGEAAACLRARADALLAFGRLEDALAAYQSCVEDRPDDPGALAGIVEAEAELGHAEEALAAARRLVEASASDEARRAALDVAARVASRFADRGQHAADLLEAAAAVELRASASAGDGAHDLAERALEALLRAGENARAAALMALAASTAQGPRRAGFLLRLGEAAGARGDVAAARAARGEALVADPSNSALRDRLLADLDSAGDGAGLARALEAALEAPGADVAALSLRLGRARAAAGDGDGAERAFATVCALGPATPGWEEAAREISARLEGRGELGACARLELARAEGAGDDATRSAALLAAAAYLERSGAMEEALAVASRARAAAPDDAAPWGTLARLRLASGDPRSAAEALIAAAERSNGGAAAAAALDAAHLLDSCGCPDEVRTALELAVRAVPGSPAARAGLAERTRSAGDAAGAVQHLEQIDRCALGSEERHAYDRSLARALSQADDPRAEAAWRALFDRDEADAEAFDRLSEPLRTRADPEQWLALAARHEGALSGGADVARRRDLRCERAALLAELGRLGAAEGAWQAALALDPRSRRALSGLRALLEHRGDHAGAADRIAAEALVAGDPEETAELLLDEARISLGRLGDVARASRVLRAAVKKLEEVPPRRARRLLVQVKRMGRRAGTSLEGSGMDADPPASRALEVDPGNATWLERGPALSGDDRARIVAAHRQRVRGAVTPAGRAAALRDLGHVLAAAPESLPEAVEVLERAHALDSGNGATAAALGRALLALGHPERTMAVMARFEAGAPDLAPGEVAQLLVAAAQAAGDPARAVELAGRVADRAPRDAMALAALSAALAGAGREREAIAVDERALALEPPGPERVERQAALAARAEAAGDPERAMWLWEGVRAARPGDASVLAALARLHAAERDWFELAAVARELELAAAGDVLGPLSVDAGRALLLGGDPALALRYLRRAAASSPEDAAILSDLAAAADRCGYRDEAERARAAALERATIDPAAGANGSAPPRAAAPPSIRDALARARAAPFDPAVSGETASLARLLASGTSGAVRQQLVVLARSAAALAAFSAGTRPRATSPRGPAVVSAEARDAVAPRLARSPAARLLAVMAPWLEPLFPVDLGQRGISVSHRVGSGRFPQLAALLEESQRSLGTRSCAAFVADGSGVWIAIENTRPPSLVAGAGLPGASPAEQRFLLARALVLLDLGWALAGKFAPGDLLMAFEVACRFAGSPPPSSLLAPDRARPFEEALARNVPAAIRDRAAPLAAEAAPALATLAPRQLTTALRQAASRAALLHAGDPHAALGALLASDPRLSALPLAGALEEPELADLGAFALSDDYLDRRAEVEAPP